VLQPRSMSFPMDTEPRSLNAQLVFGLPIQDGETAQLARRTLNAVVGTCVIMLVGGILQLMAGYEPTFVLVSVALGSLVPACGYFGTKNSDSNLLMLFCACTGWSCINCVFQIYRMIMYLKSTDGKGLGDEEAHGEMGRSLDILIIGGGILQAVACPLYLYATMLATSLSNKAREGVAFSSAPLPPVVAHNVVAGRQVVEATVIERPRNTDQNGGCGTPTRPSQRGPPAAFALDSYWPSQNGSVLETGVPSGPTVRRIP